MISRRTTAAVLAVALSAFVVGGVTVITRQAYFTPKTINAYFTSATGIYAGDEVRVSGVKVGTVESIQPQGDKTELTLAVDRDVPIPADAKAVIVAQNVVAARYVQLAPAYHTSGPLLADGAVIPVERTAVPVEWDEVKAQLMRLATDLGPTGQASTTSVGRFIDSAANALDGNGEKLRQTLAQLSGVGRILADGSGSIADIITNLQTFVTALRDSNTSIVQFQDRLATLASVIDDSRSSLDAALKDLSVAVGDIQRFIAQSRNHTAEQIQRLGNATQNLVDHQKSLEQVLHVAPNAASNAYNYYNPNSGAPAGALAFAHFQNPVQFLCSTIGAIENTTAPETAKLCAQYLGPALRLLNFNHLPFAQAPFLAPSPAPDKIIYSEDRLAPGGDGPKPGSPEQPPAVSAYTGLPGADPAGPPPPPPPARIPGVATPLPPPTDATGFTPDQLSPADAAHLPPDPPRPAPPSLPEMLLPAERPTP
ncbi:MCE family protein [Mycobacterium sp. OAE908]|uniref:MCE family protein n=1 Tax=Mycobacterium sp. OAE908 TaxID=2817899 RepID=UPI001AE530D5